MCVCVCVCVYTDHIVFFSFKKAPASSTSATKHSSLVPWGFVWLEPAPLLCTNAPTSFSRNPYRPSQITWTGPNEHEECSVASVVSDSSWPYRLQLTRLLCPWDSPGKNTGVEAMLSSRGSFQPGVVSESLMSPALAGDSLNPEGNQP